MNFSYWEKKHWISSCDYLIVGMGLTGLQSAINIKIKSPKASVLVVDRFAWNLGASTRNAGFACFANISEILSDLKNESAEAVYGLASRRYKGLLKLRSNFTDKAIGYKEKGSVEIFTKKNQADLENAIDSMQGINSILSQEMELDNVFSYSSNCHLPNMIGGIHNAYEGQLNTGMLYSTMYEKASSLGIKLMGGMELSNWSSREVSFTNGWEVKIKQLIFCTNAFSQKHGGEKVVPARGQVIVSQRFEEMPCLGLHHYDHGYYYWRDIDDRILLGGARNIDITGEETHRIESNVQVVNELKRFMEEEIVGSAVSIDYQWSGIMAMGTGKEKSPIIEQLADNSIIAVRLGGMGVALSALIAEEVAEMVNE